MPIKRKTKKHNATGRSIGGGASFVMLHRYMLRSAAWLELTAQERCVYIALSERYNGSNNGRIPLSAREAAKLCNISKNTAAKALRKLEALGFCMCTTIGSFSLKLNHTSEWRLTEHKCDVKNLPATKAFMRWQPEKKHGSNLNPPRCRLEDTQAIIRKICAENSV